MSTQETVNWNQYNLQLLLGELNNKSRPSVNNYNKMTKNILLFEPIVVISSQDKSGASSIWTIRNLDITKILCSWEMFSLFVAANCYENNTIRWGTQNVSRLTFLVQLSLLRRREWFIPSFLFCGNGGFADLSILFLVRVPEYAGSVILTRCWQLPHSLRGFMSWSLVFYYLPLYLLWCRRRTTFITYWFNRSKSDRSIVTSFTITILFVYVTSDHFHSFIVYYVDWNKSCHTGKNLTCLQF